MNKYIIINVFLICFLCLNNVFAQQIETAKQTESPIATEKPQITDLNLSEEQLQQLEEIRKTNALDRNALKQNSGNNKESALKMVEDYQQTMSDAFEKILTVEQLEIYKNNKNALEELKTLKQKPKKESNQE